MHDTQTLNKQTYFISKQKWYCTRALLEPNWYRKNTHTHAYTHSIFRGGDACFPNPNTHIHTHTPTKRLNVPCAATTKAIPRPWHDPGASSKRARQLELMLKRATEKKKKHLYNINKNNKYKNNAAAKTCPKKKCAKKEKKQRSNERTINPEKSLSALLLKHLICNYSGLWPIYYRENE